MRTMTLWMGLTAAALVASGCGSSVETTDTTTGAGGSGGSGSSSTASAGGGIGGASSSSSSSGAGGEGGAGGGASSSSSSGSGGAAECVVTPTEGVVVVTDSILFGDTDRDGTPNDEAWAQYGFNLDGKLSTAASTDLCKPNGGLAETIYPDGIDGIDNAFGKIVLPDTILSFQADFPAQVNANIQAGGFGLLLHLDKLGVEANQDPITTRFFSGAPTLVTPLFDGSDCWPVRPDSLTGGDISKPLTIYPNSNLVDDLWSSGASSNNGTVRITLSFLGNAMTLTIHQVRLSMLLDADHQGATMGQLGGVIDTEEFIGELSRVINGVDPSYCGYVSILEGRIRGASDILKDGTQDPSKKCDGISVGLGFTAKSVKLGNVGEAVPPQGPACP